MVRATKRLEALSGRLFGFTVQNRGFLLQINRLGEITLPFICSGEKPTRQAVGAIHFQHFQPAFDCNVVIPSCKHGCKCEGVDHRRQWVNLLSLLHVGDGFFNAIRLSEIHPVPKEGP